MRAMAEKSAGLNTASLYATKAGPYVYGCEGRGMSVSVCMCARISIVVRAEAFLCACVHALEGGRAYIIFLAST